MHREIMPCPCCGAPAELRENRAGDYSVRCTDKGCALRTRNYHENDAGAIIAWNARPAAIIVDSGQADTQATPWALLSCGHMAWGERVAWCPECGKRVRRS